MEGTFLSMAVTRSSVHINATREAVWAVLTDPMYVKQWQYGSVLETSWTVGSPIRFTTEWEGQTLQQRGTVLAVDVPTEVRYSLFAPRPGLEDRPENYFTMTYRLAVDGEGTTLTIIQEDPRPGAGERELDQSEDNPVLAALKQVAESVSSQYDAS